MPKRKHDYAENIFESIEYELFCRNQALEDDNSELLKIIIIFMNNLKNANTKETLDILNDFTSSELYKHYVDKKICKLPDNDDSDYDPNLDTSESESECEDDLGYEGEELEVEETKEGFCQIV